MAAVPAAVQGNRIKIPCHALHKILNERVFRNVPILQNPSENYF
jgi:hypothetical protein